MEATFRIWETSRSIYLKFLENYSLEQLNSIPVGMSNNLIWNMGHVLVSQQKLVYALSGLPMHISDSLFEKYQNGSRPDGKTTQDEVDEIKKLLLEMIEKTKPDIVSIITPPAQHFEHCQLALNKGCHVFCEKSPARQYQHRLRRRHM